MPSRGHRGAWGRRGAGFPPCRRPRYVLASPSISVMIRRVPELVLRNVLGAGQEPAFLLGVESPCGGRRRLRSLRAWNQEMSSVEDRIAALTAPLLARMGYRLVRAKLAAQPRRTLQVMIERLDARPIAVADCEAVSRALSPQLDVAEPLRGAYDLEVSSAGIDRPLTAIEDFDRFEGFEARIRLDPAIAGRKRLSGRLGEVRRDAVEVTLDDGSRLEVPFAAIDEARLALTDELIAAMTPPSETIGKG